MLWLKLWSVKSFRYRALPIFLFTSAPDTIIVTGSSTLNFSPSGLPTLVPALFNSATNHVKSALSDLQHVTSEFSARATFFTPSSIHPGVKILQTCYSPLTLCFLQSSLTEQLVISHLNQTDNTSDLRL